MKVTNRKLIDMRAALASLIQGPDKKPIVLSYAVSKNYDKADAELKLFYRTSGETLKTYQAEGKELAERLGKRNEKGLLVMRAGVPDVLPENRAEFDAAEKALNEKYKEEIASVEKLLDEEVDVDFHKIKLSAVSDYQIDGRVMHTLVDLFE